MDSYAAFIMFFIFLHLGKTELICDDFMVTLPNGFCLQLHKVNTTWTKAKVECQKQNGSLVAISNNTVESFIRKYLNGSKVTADVWLGAKTRKRWFWKDGDKFRDGSELTWFAWGAGEPNDDNSAEDFVMLWQRADYLWNDQHGDTKENHLVISKFICEDTNRSCSQNGECAVKGHGVSRCVYHNATCFYLRGHYGTANSYKDAKRAGTTRADAEEDCKRKNQRLAHIENWSTLNALRQRIREDTNLAGNYWIGAAWDREQGAKWTWENGDEVKYSNWNMKPDEQPDVVKAAKLSAGFGYKWDAENTNAENYYLCQYEPSIVVTTTPDSQTTNGLSSLYTTTTKRNPTTVLSSGVSSTEEPQTESTQVEAIRTTNVELDLTTALLKDLLSSTETPEPISNEIAVLEDFSALEENQYQSDHDWGLAAAIGIPVLFAAIVLAVFSIIYTKRKMHPLRARLLGDLFTTVENPLYKAGLEDNPNPTIDKLKSYKGRRPFARDYDHSNVYQDHRIDTVSESCTDPSPVPLSNEIDSIYDTIESCTQDTMSPIFSETTCTGQNQPIDNQRHLLGSVETSGGGGDVH